MKRTKTTYVYTVKETDGQSTSIELNGLEVESLLQRIARDVGYDFYNKFAPKPFAF